jgi:hypothetical protein
VPSKTETTEPPALVLTDHDHRTLAHALAAFQAELPKVGKDNTAQVKSDKGQYTYRYADLSEISPVVLPLLAKHGLAWTTLPSLDGEGRFALEYRLTHTSSQSLHGTYPLPAPGSSPQVLGSGITYARRYALCAVTGVAPGDDDDDAQAVQAQHRQERQGATQRPQRPQGARNADRSGSGTGQRPQQPQGPPAGEGHPSDGAPGSKSAEAAFNLLAKTCEEKGWDRAKVAELYAERHDGAELARANMRQVETWRRELLKAPADVLARLTLGAEPIDPPAQEAEG